ncbi:BlaI/MecI/CopY family transcriptional regulator [Oscillochloris sp. ZM17-4]|uniref:BlaI/MecI/CopY family transcriptional regulator n=1 Tax=Oscillochloris sp. ZM17-4 TaxID=2866714 RepID=UPI001C73523F|nr:BlaI/MecI/CopY family transcriptional regulator [Oscillochloris sp. ZM17-4]MBX0328660.1 BlaI/MecI/CopY family transcriptional regulator [Oscillochloris sp. ZM17-4]
MARLGAFTFRPHGAGIEKFFGSLESAILELMWSEGECSARQIYEALRDNGKRISYGATKTVLDRLVRKQILQRVADGRRFLYVARMDRATLMHKLVNMLIISLRDEADSDIVTALTDEIDSLKVSGTVT